MTFQTMCALRVYLKQGDNAPGKSFLRRFMRKPLSTHLLQAALKAGVTHASLHMAAMGFAADAKLMSMDLNEIPSTTLPVCVELVAPKPLLEQYVQDHARHLKSATLVMLEGVHVRPQIVEDDGTPHPHHVEYVTAGALSVPIDHVEVDKPAPTKKVAVD
jgi:PII-like signaling protein